MRSLVVVLVSLLATEVTGRVTEQTYSSVHLDTSTTDNVVFTSPARSVLLCAALCRQRESCVTFTFDDLVCRGHSAVQLTPNTNFTDRKTARAYVEVRKTQCGSSDSGVVTISPGGQDERLEVYCDRYTDGGGWLVFQRRQDGSVDFYRNWTQYQQGFGDLRGEFWLGLDNLYTVTSHGTWELRVDLMAFNATRGYAIYSNFFISDSSDNYRLHYDEYIEGNAGDSLSENLKNQQFSTYDADHDTFADGNCAARDHGAWWYESCHRSNLNGRYTASRVFSMYDVLLWYNFDGWHSLKMSEMKVRPT